MPLLKRLMPYIMRYPMMVWGTLGFLVLASLITLSLPLALRRIIDHDFSVFDSTFTFGHFWILIVLSFFLALSSALRHYFITLLGERVISDLRCTVFSHLIRLSPGFFDRTQSSEVVSRLIADTTLIKSVLGSTSSLALRNLILGVSSVVMMLVTSFKLSSLVLGVLPIIILPLVFFGRFVRARSRFAQDSLARASACAQEKISDIRTIQAFTAESSIMERFVFSIEENFSAARNTTIARSVLVFAAIVMVFSSIVGILWLGSYSVRAGEISPGMMGQFLLYAVLAAAALGALSEVWAEFAQAGGALDRLFEILDEKPSILSSETPKALPQALKKGVEFNNVTFSYPTRPDRRVFSGLSFTVEPGEMVALVGSSGTGKSTVFSLLLRFYDPQEGRISCDGIDIRELCLSDLRRSIALVPQDISLFSSSILENIILGNPYASPDQIKYATQAALVNEFVDKLPQGLKSFLGERGMNLSGGQRQRLAIARAILRNAPILLLDEATSSLDVESERSVQSALQELMRNKTTLVVTHRLETVLQADRILVIGEGRILEEGTHTHLISKNGIYAHLVKMQFNPPESSTH